VIIIVDTSVWIDHLRSADPVLIALLGDGRQRVHPHVIGELALGSLRDRETVPAPLGRMSPAQGAEPEESMRPIADRALHGLGIGYVDVHLLASVKLMRGFPALDTRPPPGRRRERLARTGLPGAPLRLPAMSALPVGAQGAADLSKP